MSVGLSAGLVILAVLAYGAMHSFMASLWVKARLHGWFGALADRWYRLIYNLVAVVTLAPVLGLSIALPGRHLYTIPLPWLGLTSLIQLLAIGGLLIGLLQNDAWSFLGIRQLMKDERGAGSGLVVTGLYRWVRHPLYTAGLVFIWLTPVMTTNLLALNLGLTVYIIIGAGLEERKLVREFGQAYRSYQQHTPMLIPGLCLRGQIRSE